MTATMPNLLDIESETTATEAEWAPAPTAPARSQFGWRLAAIGAVSLVGALCAAPAVSQHALGLNREMKETRASLQGAPEPVGAANTGCAEGFDQMAMIHAGSIGECAAACQELEGTDGGGCAFALFKPVTETPAVTPALSSSGAATSATAPATAAPTAVTDPEPGTVPLATPVTTTAPGAATSATAPATAAPTAVADPEPGTVPLATPVPTTAPGAATSATAPATAAPTAVTDPEPGTAPLAAPAPTTAPGAMTASTTKQFAPIGGETTSMQFLPISQWATTKHFVPIGGETTTMQFVPISQWATTKHFVPIGGETTTKHFAPIGGPPGPPVPGPNDNCVLGRGICSQKPEANTALIYVGAAAGPQEPIKPAPLTATEVTGSATAQASSNAITDVACGTGCANWQDIMLEMTFDTTLAKCEERCNALGCAAYNFQHFSCDPPAPGENTCYIYGPGCQEQKDDCWDLFKKGR